MNKKNNIQHFNTNNSLIDDYTINKHTSDPITSWGIILVNLNNIELNTDLQHKTINMNMYVNNISPQTYKDLENLGKIINGIKFLLIERKNSLGYIDFIRGKYKIDNIDQINYLFQQMNDEEIKRIGKHDFTYLWNNLWNENIDDKEDGDYKDDKDDKEEKEESKKYKKEYLYAKNKFETLKSSDNLEINLDFYVKNVKPLYKINEWGFPKGRKNRNETSLECAKREFFEETNIDSSKIKVIEDIEPICENLVGTNGVKYRHIYYIAEINTNQIVKPNNNEIGNIGYFLYNDAIQLLREYHIEKRDILTKIYMYYVEILLKNQR
jgi:8-oxo-dGTP pyrophosphatase MutT (NUDIX family)